MIFLPYLSLHFTLRSTIRFKGAPFAPKHVQKFEAKFYACNNLLCKIKGNFSRFCVCLCFDTHFLFVLLLLSCYVINKDAIKCDDNVVIDDVVRTVKCAFLVKLVKFSFFLICYWFHMQVNKDYQYLVNSCFYPVSMFLSSSFV